MQTAYGYLMMRKATEYPARQHSKEFLEKGIGVLEEVISEHGATTPYPFHVLGNQGLAWARYGGTLEGIAKRAFLERLRELAGRGLELHPWSRELRDLCDALKKESLLTVVRPADS